MKDNVKSALNFIGFMCAVTVSWFALRTTAESTKKLEAMTKCHHDGWLTHIGPTWRVNASLWTGDRETELGVCKACGVITDVKQRGDGWMAHFPIAGAPTNSPARFGGVTIEPPPKPPPIPPKGKTIL